MQRTIEWLLLALPYIATGGAVFTDWGKSHKSLVVLAGLIALITTGYFVRDRYLEWYGGPPKPHRITSDITTLEFFDPVTSKPRAWYSKDQAGTYILYDASGFDPFNGDPLQPITAEIARDILSKVVAAKDEERRRIEELRVKQQQEADRQAAQARQRDKDAQDAARAQEQARRQAVQDEIDRQNAIRQQQLDAQRKQQEQQLQQARQREQAQAEWRRTHNGCNIGTRWACFDCQRTNAPECIHIGGNGGCLCVPN